ncbi:MAG: hypothetical protein RL329_277, partial [Bacteroidota bacterium]
MSGLCSLLPFLTGLGSALLGGAIGWHWLKRTRLAQLLGVIDEKDHSYTELNSTHEQHRLQYRSLQGDYLVADNAQKDWEGKYQQMSESYRRLDRSKTSLTTDFDGFKTKSAQTVGDLERQLKEMTARYEQMNTAHQAATGRVKVLETNFATLQKDFGALKVDYDSVASQNKSFTIQVAKLTGEKNALDAA